jgi:hypothetical protein
MYSIFKRGQLLIQSVHRLDKVYLGFCEHSFLLRQLFSNLRDGQRFNNVIRYMISRLLEQSVGWGCEKEVSEASIEVS